MTDDVNLAGAEHQIVPTADSAQKCTFFNRESTPVCFEFIFDLFK